VDCVLLWYNNWTYFDKPISKSIHFICVQYTFAGASHPWKSKGRACLPALCLEYYHLFRWENALILKPWNGIFLKVFFRSIIVRRGEIFFAIDCLFLLYFFADFVFYLLFSFFNSWFPMVSLKNLFKSPVNDTIWIWKVLTLANEVFFLTPISSLVWVELFFPTVFDNACA